MSLIAAQNRHYLTKAPVGNPLRRVRVLFYTTFQGAERMFRQSAPFTAQARIIRHALPMVRQHRFVFVSPDLSVGRFVCDAFGF